MCIYISIYVFIYANFYRKIQYIKDSLPTTKNGSNTFDSKATRLYPHVLKDIFRWFIAPRQWRWFIHQFSTRIDWNKKDPLCASRLMGSDGWGPLNWRGYVVKTLSNQLAFFGVRKHGNDSKTRVENEVVQYHSVWGVAPEHRSFWQPERETQVSTKKPSQSQIDAGSYEGYLKSMAADGTWGDHVTLQASVSL